MTYLGPKSEMFISIVKYIIFNCYVALCNLWYL
jgi:hypothetical protein